MKRLAVMFVVVAEICNLAWGAVLPFRYVPQSQASFASCAATCAGRGGWLATPENATQNSLALAGLPTVGQVFAMLGAVRSTVDSQWRWAAGPLSGTVFFSGINQASGSCQTYCAFTGPNPDNANNNEDAIVMVGGLYPPFGWWDFPSSRAMGCLCEQYNPDYNAASAANAGVQHSVVHDPFPLGLTARSSTSNFRISSGAALSGLTIAAGSTVYMDLASLNPSLSSWTLSVVGCTFGATTGFTRQIK